MDPAIPISSIWKLPAFSTIPPRDEAAALAAIDTPSSANPAANPAVAIVPNPGTFIGVLLPPLPLAPPLGALIGRGAFPGFGGEKFLAARSALRTLLE